MRRAVGLGCLLALVAVSACGSTAQQSVRADSVLSAPGGTAPDGVAAPGGSSDAVPAVPGAGAPGAPGAVAPGPGASRGPAAVAQRPTLAASTGVPTSGPGWDAKNVYVGVVTQKDTQQVFASFGADYVDPGDTERQARAAADAVNAAGGILGRRLTLVFRDIQILQTNQDPSGVGESVCTSFTQDRRVMAVWNISTQIDQAPTLRGCLAKAGVPLFSSAGRAVDDQLFAALGPHYYQSLMVSWTRLAPAFVGRLKAQGYLTGWDAVLGRAGGAPVVVGLLVQDVPEGARTAAALTRALQSAGVRSVETFAYTRPEEGQSASVQSFKGRGVTHVVVTDVELLAFQQAAASQGYKPRYGITTYNAPYANLERGGLSPPGANNGAVGVGWAPTLDVGPGKDPGPTPGWQRCSRAMSAQQQSFDGKRLAQTFAATLCDTFFLLQGAAKAGNGLTATAIRAGVAQVGRSFPLAVGFGPALSAAAPFAPGVLRDLAWDATCGCLVYGRGTAAVAT